MEHDSFSKCFNEKNIYKLYTYEITKLTTVKIVIPSKFTSAMLIYIYQYFILSEPV